MDIGFLNTGFDIVWHNECNPRFCHGFEYGLHHLFPKKDSQLLSVQNHLPVEQLIGRDVLNEAFDGIGRPHLFGIIGGPPCPDFSNGGSHAGPSGYKGSLFEVFVSMILDIHPTFFLIENVPGMVKTSRNRAFLVRLLERLSQIYQVDLELLNALHFGAPQDRNRLFAIGFSRDWLAREKPHLLVRSQPSWSFQVEQLRKKRIRSLGRHARRSEHPDMSHWFPWPVHALFANAKRKYSWPHRIAFGELPERPAHIPKELMAWTWIGADEHLEDLPNGQDIFNVYSRRIYTIDEGDVSRKSFKRLHRWRYSPPAAYGNNEVHLHPTKPRRLSVREALRLQTVPDPYQLPPTMTLTDKFKTIGNGVPVVLGQAVAERIRRVLESTP